MKAGVSVVICCHNSSKRLSETLRHLAAQEVGDSIPWEIVIVDNASTDETAEAALQLCPVELGERLRVVSEPTPGLSSARIKGVREAAYEIICFIDDDNWVNPDFVECASNIFAGDPLIGLAGGPSEPVYETAPPEWFEKVKGFYAIGNQHAYDGDITKAQGTLLWGAGLSMRKKAFIGLFGDGFCFQGTGRKGKKLTAGEDSELCFALRASGWRIIYDSTLKLRHYIPASRLTWNYSKSLLRGMGRSSVILNAYRISLRHQKKATLLGQCLKETWIAQTSKSLKNLISLFCAAPLRCLRESEGTHQVLLFQSALGEFEGHFELFGVYQKLIRELRQAKWNKEFSSDGKGGAIS